MYVCMHVHFGEAGLGVPLPQPVLEGVDSGAKLDGRPLAGVFLQRATWVIAVDLACVIAVDLACVGANVKLRAGAA